MSFVLDTNIVGKLRKKRPHPAVAQWVMQTGWENLIMSVVSVTEIQRSTERTLASDPTLAQDLETWLGGIFAVGEPMVLEMGVNTARLLARTHESPGFRHFVVTDPAAQEQATGADRSIAAIAIATENLVASQNIRRFRRINGIFPLSALFNPFDQTWAVTPTASS